MWCDVSCFFYRLLYIPVPTTLLSNLLCLLKLALCSFLSLYTRLAKALRYGMKLPFWVFRRLRGFLLRPAMVTTEGVVGHCSSFYRLLRLFLVAASRAFLAP